MKINAIKQLCKAEAHCLILTDVNGEQWIGTNGGIYPVDGVEIRADSIPALFDLTEQERAKVAIVEQLMPGSDFDAQLCNSREMYLSRLSLEAADGVYDPLICHGQVFLIAHARVKAAVGDRHYRRFYLVYNQQDQPIILVQDGLTETVAMLKPLEKASVEKTQTILRGVAFPAAGGWLQETEKEEPREDEEQLEMDDLPDAQPLEQRAEEEL